MRRNIYIIDALKICFCHFTKQNLKAWRKRQQLNYIQLPRIEMLHNHKG